ncbi:hypothetical protein MLD38_017634 [Melastoma candidum]|uniref:Uncharacterized protein n=1 Tax=Melastoma candidum TaxID=119954 RepID=A0ACB9QQF4_9MYRT|nr:hypothetical protein MLD38_017634 [Melastoma candidum]
MDVLSLRFAPPSLPRASSFPSAGKEGGIGIARFLNGKKLFITGVTGYLAKVLVEKIMRAVPDVGKVYVLINAKAQDAARGRLINEIINCELFRCLRQIHGKSYEAFMMSKLVPVAGNITSPSLGIREDLIDSITEEVDIIVNSAGSTTFDERYDMSLAANTQGPCNLLTFGQRCRELKVFLHVSTVYANGKRKGNIKEMPFHINDHTIIRDNLDGEDKSPSPMPILDVEGEISLATRHAKDLEAPLTKQALKELGSKRAKKYGWQDTYTFTKAMGEMMIDKYRGDIPVVIIRPSIIEGTHEEPFPGWIQGNRMIDPVVLSYGKGLLTSFLSDEKTVIDVVPADMVVNAILAATVKQGLTRVSGIRVYHVGSSVANPLLLGELFRLFYVHFNTTPFMDSRRRLILVRPIELFNSKDGFLNFLNRESLNGGHLAEGASSSEGIYGKKAESIRRKSLERTKYIARLYEPYTFYDGRFDNSNTERLMESMSEDEKVTFRFDVRRIDWTDYIPNIHIPGVRRYVAKEDLHCRL